MFLKLIKNGLFTQNPVFVLLLGMCPTLAVSTNIMNALGMGLSATAVLVCSNFMISLLRKVIPPKIRIAAYIVIVAAFVSAIDLLLQAYLPAVSKSLGLFIPLIVVNCIILARAESYASKNNPLCSAADGLGMGIGFTLALTVVAVIREVLGSGTFLAGTPLEVNVLPASIPPAMLISLPAGGFLTLGFVLAIIQKRTKRQ